MPSCWKNITLLYYIWLHFRFPKMKVQSFLNENFAFLNNSLQPLSLLLVSWIILQICFSLHIKRVGKTILLMNMLVNHQLCIKCCLKQACVGKTKTLQNLFCLCFLALWCHFSVHMSCPHKSLLFVVANRCSGLYQITPNPGKSTTSSLGVAVLYNVSGNKSVPVHSVRLLLNRCV